MPTLVETLAWLVDIPSETRNEASIRDQIGDRLAGRPQKKVGSSLVVGDPTEDSILLVGHTDTVPLQGHVGARLEGDRLYGLGATDMKGGLAVMIHLLEELGDSRLVGVFYAGEEGPMDGNELGLVLDEVPALTGASAGVVMEPTNREVHLGCQGAINATIGFEGEAAHSARPWLGDNAISKAGEFLSKIHAHPADTHVVEGLEFIEVISVTKAEGGVAHNIIPSEFTLNVNYRFAPDRSTDEAIEHLREVCALADSFTVFSAAPAAYPEGSHPFFKRLAEASGGAVESKQGWTDVAQLAAAGVPGVNFGPGETSLAHKPGESVRLDDLDWAFEGLSQALAN